MSGYPDAGGDHRLLPSWPFGYLQRLLIIYPKPIVKAKMWRGWLLHWHVTAPPFFLAERPNGKGKWRQIRFGWAFRKLQQYYLFGIAFKKEDGPLPDYN